MRQGICLSDRMVIQNFKKNCLEEMHKNGLECIDPIVATGRIYNFLVKGDRDKPHGWYMANEGVTKNELQYVRCVYGPVLRHEMYKYNSWQSDFNISKKDNTFLEELIKDMDRYLESEIGGYLAELKAKYFEIKNVTAVVSPTTKSDSTQTIVSEPPRIIVTEKASTISESKTFEILQTPDVQHISGGTDWANFLAQLDKEVSDFIVKSLFQNAQILAISSQYISIKLSISSIFFHSKLSASKEKWMRAFQKAYPFKKLVIEEVKQSTL